MQCCRAAGPPTADKCVVLLSLVHQPGETLAPASFVVHTPTKTQRKRNGTRRRRRRDDKLVTIVSRWMALCSVTVHQFVTTPHRVAAARSLACWLSFFAADDHFSPDIAVHWLLLSSEHALYVYQLSVIRPTRFSSSFVNCHLVVFSHCYVSAHLMC